MNSIDNSNQKVRLEQVILIVEEKLKNNGEVTFSPNGVSMLPLIRPGRDSVTLRGDIVPKVGDAVFYKRPSGQFVLHRIMAKDESFFVLCGDNQLVLEKGVANDWIIGVVTSVSRDGKEIKRESKKMAIYLKTILPCHKCWLRVRCFLGKVKRKIKSNH